MIETKNISVLLNLNPKYLDKELIFNHIESLLENNIENKCFQGLGKVIKIKKIISIGLGKIHVDTGFSKTPVTFEADIYLPKIDDVVVGYIERYDSNGGVYVNYNNILSIFCLNTNINALLKNKEKKIIKSKNNYNESNFLEKDMSSQSQNNEDLEQNLGLEVSVKITKVNINEQNIIVIGKII